MNIGPSFTKSGTANAGDTVQVMPDLGPNQQIVVEHECYSAAGTGKQTLQINGTQVPRHVPVNTNVAFKSGIVLAPGQGLQISSDGSGAAGWSWELRMHVLTNS